MTKSNQTRATENPEKILPKISSNKKLKGTTSAKNLPPLNKQPNLINKKQLINSLKKCFKNKLSIDEQVKQKLYEEEVKKIENKKRIQNDLQQINKQNTIWINKLNEYLKLVDNKKQLFQISESMKEEKELISQYHKLQEEQKKMHLVKSERSKLEQNHWSEIAKQQHKLSHIIRKNQKQLLLIARIKSHETGRKNEPVKQPQEKKQDDSKKLKKSKNIQQLKQLGRKYLEFAKKAQKSKSERKLLKIQNKNIDYAQQMKHLIKLKVEDLSKYPEAVPDQTLSTKRKKFFKNTLASADSLNLKNNVINQSKITKQNKQVKKS